MRLLITGGSGFIGTNYVAFALSKGRDVCNLDVSGPLDPDHRSCWQACDIMDPSALHDAFALFRPTHVIHMAARTECVENVDLNEAYDVNITGTRNVLAAIRDTPGIERVIITSSQYVCGPDHFPKGAEDYGPHTVYGQSKVLTENLTREAELPCSWALIRPVNIWGPWHMRYRREAWSVIRRGYYFHPGGKPVMRTYGYVGNVIWQCEQIFAAPAEKVHAKALYVGDKEIDIYDWVDAFSVMLAGRRARKIPRPLLRAIALTGDVVTTVTGIKFPLTSSRYRSMTQDYVTPISETFDLFGTPPYGLREGVAETVKWLQSYGWNS